jgi:hypothetical protein
MKVWSFILTLAAGFLVGFICGEGKQATAIQKAKSELARCRDLSWGWMVLATEREAENERLAKQLEATNDTP